MKLELCCIMCSIMLLCTDAFGMSRERGHNYSRSWTNFKNITEKKIIDMIIINRIIEVIRENRNPHIAKIIIMLQILTKERSKNERFWMKNEKI